MRAYFDVVRGRASAGGECAESASANFLLLADIAGLKVGAKSWRERGEREERVAVGVWREARATKRVEARRSAQSNFEPAFEDILRIRSQR